MSDEAVLDTTLPILDSISIKDPIVDRGEGDNNVTVVLAASDADSEVASIRVTVTDPDGGTMVKTLSAASGELTFTISDDKPEGEYKVTEVVVTDTAGNARTYDGPNLSSLFEVAVTVVNAEEDITPPELVDFQIVDPVVDYSSGDRSVIVNVTLSDDISGVGSGYLSLIHTGSGKEVARQWLDNGSVTFNLPDNIENGQYSIKIWAVDNAQNTVFINSADIQSAGFDATITISGAIEDTAPPDIIDLTVLDPVVDIGSGDTSVTLQYEFGDDLSGVYFFKVVIEAPEGSDWSSTQSTSASKGNLTFDIPENALNGDYTIRVYLKDHAQNSRWYSSEEISSEGFDGSFQVVNADEDITPPELVKVEIQDPIVDTDTGDHSVTIGVELSDNISGLATFTIRLKSPEGQTVNHTFTDTSIGSHTFTIPAHYANGQYELNIYGQDHAGNNFYYTYSNLQEMGFTAAFELVETMSGNDDDHDNGHGNDEDGVDDDNPGNSDGSNGGGNGGGDHDDNGHGNDEDGVDESNPGNSTGTHRRIKGTDDNDTITGSDDNDTITGGDGDDNLEAGDGNDQIWAGANDTGNDRLAGGRGNDVIGGGKGNDLLVGGNRRKGDDDSDDDGSDILYGGDGDDTLIGGGWDDSSGDGTFSLGEEASDELEANSLWGGDGDDLIIGANGADTVGGGVGNDRVNAGGGNDKVFGGRGGEGGSNDVIDGGDGNDVVFASDGNDSVLGGDGDDDLFGGSGDDTVHGGDGDDTIWGGAGDDLFTGGGGGDIFAFGATSGKDTVTDFSVAEDELRLTGTVTDFTDTASVAAAATVATVAGQAGLLIDTGGGNSVFLVGLTVEDLSNMVMLLD